MVRRMPFFTFVLTFFAASLYSKDTLINISEPYSHGEMWLEITYNDSSDITDLGLKNIWYGDTITFSCSTKITFMNFRVVNGPTSGNMHAGFLLLIDSTSSIAYKYHEGIKKQYFHYGLYDTVQFS